MSYQLYKVLHIAAVLFTMASLGALTLHAINGGTRADRDQRKLAGMTHGIALLLILFTGFGLIAKLGLGFAPWVWLKLGVWLALGAVLAVINRAPQLGRLLWFAIPLLGAAAAYLAIYKPGA